ncbi:DUF3231 family protein [Ammoniphilus oxalaticus]|uniref:DUF3231 family protein n=1 Tax=Ammoniphilus oxalaticus TaxID=66863 RepID=UPI00147534F3|nr:DUF3231 family protein [Ammoniphilus oxalaticus]
MRLADKPMTAPELSNLWATFQSNSMANCILRYFSAKAEDEEIKSTIDFALRIAQQQTDRIKNLFAAEEIAIPIGFTDSDVDVNAPRLLSDMFMLEYIKHMASVGMMTYSSALYISSRADVREIFDDCLISSIQLERRSSQVLLEKGIFVQPPYLSPPQKVDFVKNQTFLNGWLGERRPITGIEITSLFINMITNSIGKALITSFAQVAEMKDVRKYLIRGKHIATKHLSVFGSILTEENTDVAPTWDSHVTDSTAPPFSDKLMLFHTIGLIAFGIANYGTALSSCARRDISSHYERLMQEILLYAEDGMNLMIKRGWMEEPPLTVDRGELIKK